MTRATYNFLRGMGSVLDLLPSSGPSRVGMSINLKRTDGEALRKDWQQVARDFRVAYDQTVKEVGDHGQAK